MCEDLGMEGGAADDDAAAAVAAAVVVLFARKCIEEKKKKNKKKKQKKLKKLKKKKGHHKINCLAPWMATKHTTAGWGRTGTSPKPARGGGGRRGSGMSQNGPVL